MVEQADALSIERLRILDMFLLYPALLHRVRLSGDIKRQVREIEIAKPERTFVRLPSLPSVWQDLRIYQSTALKHLAGRGMLKREALLDRHASLDEAQVPQEVMKRALEANSEQIDLMIVLIGSFSGFADGGVDGLAQRTHLPARGPVL